MFYSVSLLKKIVLVLRSTWSWGTLVLRIETWGTENQITVLPVLAKQLSRKVGKKSLHLQGPFPIKLILYTTEHKILFKHIFQIFPMTYGKTKHLLILKKANASGNATSKVWCKLQNRKVMYQQTQSLLSTSHKTMKKLAFTRKCKDWTYSNYKGNLFCRIVLRA